MDCFRQRVFLSSIDVHYGPGARFTTSGHDGKWILSDSVRSLGIDGDGGIRDNLTDQVYRVHRLSELSLDLTNLSTEKKPRSEFLSSKSPVNQLLSIIEFNPYIT